MSTLKTRKPTGLPSWPILLMAGREGAGKSWAAAQASASDLVGRTLWVGVGEDDPDEYALIPGADFEIVEHDGSYQGILGAVNAAAAEPAKKAPNLIVVDSMTRLWNLISDNAQSAANRRAKGRKNDDGDHQITMDLWNAAAGQWAAVMDAVRSHQGPSILTARLEEVVVMENGQPTAERTWKVQGHKTLPFDSTVIVQMPERGRALVTKVKSARHPLEKPEEFPGFEVAEMWKRLGLSEVQAGERTHSDVVGDEDAERKQLAAFVDAIAAEANLAKLRQMWLFMESKKWKELVVRSDGATVETLMLDRKKAIESPVEGEPADLVEQATGEVES